MNKLLMLALMLTGCQASPAFSEMSKVDGNLMMRKEAATTCLLLDKAGNNQVTGDCIETVSGDYYDAAMLGGLMGLSNTNVTAKDSTEISWRKIQCDESKDSCRVHRLNYGTWLYYGAHHVKGDKEFAKLVLNYWK